MSDFVVLHLALNTLVRSGTVLNSTGSRTGKLKWELEPKPFVTIHPYITVLSVYEIVYYLIKIEGFRKRVTVMNSRNTIIVNPRILYKV